MRLARITLHLFFVVLSIPIEGLKILGFVIKYSLMCVVNYSIQAWKYLRTDWSSYMKQPGGGPEGYRKLRFPDFMTTTQDGGKVVRLTHRPP